jgi:hypothetical protein
MSFLAPAFLFGLLAVVLPLALHLLRRRVVRTIPFPALRFLAATRADQRRHNLRRRIVLALRCLALAALAAAFARPFFGTPPAASGRATIVVIDNSFSLRAGTRWTELRHWARNQIDNSKRGDSLGLLLVNPRPTWLIAPTKDTAAALSAFDSLTPGWESTRAEPALRLAAEVLASTPASERRLVFLGDHQAAGWLGTDFAQKLPPGVAAFFPAPAAPPERQAALLTATLAREADAWVATVTARNFTAAHTRTLSLFAENSSTPLLTAPLALPAATTTSIKLTLPATLATPPAYLRLALDPDTLPADDTLWTIAPSTRNERTLLLDHPAPSPAISADYVATAFAALAALPPALHVSPPPAVAWPVPAVAILRNESSFAGESAARLDAFLRAGGTACIFLEGTPAQRAWLAARGLSPVPIAASPARIRDWELDHPFVAPLAENGLRALVGWEFTRAWSLPAAALEPLAFWADGTVALGEIRIGAGRVLIAGFTPERRDGDWPVQPAFVPFLHRTATYLLDVATTTDTAARVGVPLDLPTTPGTWRALAGPAATPADTQAQIANDITPAAPGVYEFTAPGAPRRLYAVGLSPEESDLAPWPDGTPWLNLINPASAAELSFTSRLEVANTEAEQQNPLWWWAVAALALFALAELALANRTTR